MFKQEGNFDAVIKEIVFADSRFAKDDENAFDICIKVEADIGGSVQSDWWRGEMSKKYGKGNFAGKTQAEITIENLRGIGFEGDDLTKLDNYLLNKKVNISVVGREYEGKTYYDVKYLNGNYAPKAIDKGSLAARMAGLGLGGNTPAPSSTAAMPGGGSANEGGNPLF